MREFIVSATLIVVSLVVGLILLEVILHFTPLKRQFQYPLTTSKQYFEWDATLGFDIIPNVSTTTHEFADHSYNIWSNELGCYDYPIEKGAPYIYVGGDSFAWGYTELPAKWSKVIEQNVATRTLNCGVPGFGTRQEVIKANRVISTLETPPKLMVISYFMDDAGDDSNFPAYTAYKGYVVPSWMHCDPEFMLNTSPLISTTTCNVPKPNYPLPQKIKIELAANSVLYMIAKKQFALQDKLKQFLESIAPSLLKSSGLTHENQEQFDNRSVVLRDDRYWEAHFSNLKAFKELAEKNGSKLLVVLAPFKEMLSATSTNPLWETERARAYLEKEGIAHIDLLPLLKAEDPMGKSFYWPNDVHWTPQGNKFVGDIVSSYIAQNQLLQ